MVNAPGCSLLFAVSLLLSSLAAGHAQDIRGFEIGRYEYFSQCTTNVPASTGHGLAAFVHGAYSGAVRGGTLTRGRAHWALTNAGSRLEAHARSAGSASAGAYTFAAQTASQGIQRRTVILPGPANQITPAHIANFEDAQHVDATQPFTVKWDQVRGLGTRDYIAFRVFDSEGEEVFESTLSKGHTSIIIPAGTLRPGTTNVGVIFLMHLAALRPPMGGRPYTVAVEVRATDFRLMTAHPAGGVFFPSNQVSAYETNGVVRIPVHRTGSEGTVTVDYVTEERTATAGVNYVSSAGTVTFPPGVTQQSIEIPVLDDGQSTAPLVARVRLTNVTGGGVMPRCPWLDWSVLDKEAVPGPNIDTIVLAKVAFCLQTNENPGTKRDLCVASRFFVSVHPRFPGALAAPSTFRSPRGTVRTAEMPYRTFLEYNEDFPTGRAMDRLFPTGPYTVSIDTLSQGLLNESVRLQMPPRFAMPHLTNWAEAQAINAAQPFTFKWELFRGATSNDFVHFSVTDKSGVLVLETPDVFETGALPGTTTSYEIPAQTLHAEKTYRANIVFAKTKRVSVNAASGVRTCNAFYHTTGFDIETQPAAAAMRSVPAPDVSEKACCGASSSQIIREPAFAEKMLSR